ncbi:MAG: response regulator transcription factor [Acidobacteria bacterium]|nr:response regulator transcription factor [Acidobacteriota bacterium]
MDRVLVVDDDASLTRALSIGLRAHDYDVHVVADGRLAITEATRLSPDLVLVDLGLPSMSGLEVITALRAWSSVPIIVLSARPQEAVKVAALDSGADDYLTKPFGLGELLARMRATRRRHLPDATSTVVAGDLEIDLAARRVERRGVLVHLTPKEWSALALLARHPGTLLSQGYLLESIWGPGYQEETEYLRTLFARLRRKLEEDPSHPRHLITEPGMGYRLEI